MTGIKALAGSADTIRQVLEERIVSESYRQALVGVIGGTYITLAISDIDQLTIGNFALLNTADFDTPMQAVERYLRSVPRCPDRVALAVAATVDGDTARFHHRDWVLTRNDIRAATTASQVIMVNDIEATAMMLPMLSRFDTIMLRDGAPAPRANMAVAVCGAGMGVAGLVRVGEQWAPVVGFGGEVGFAHPDEHADLAASLHAAGCRTNADIFSGRGLAALYAALAGDGQQQLSGARQIAAAGLSGENPAAVKSLQVMAGWLGRMAGDMALLYGARGGLFLGGGLAANIVPALQTGQFSQAFTGNGRRAELLRDIPVRVVKMSADAAMRGAALASSAYDLTGLKTQRKALRQGGVEHGA